MGRVCKHTCSKGLDVFIEELFLKGVSGILFCHCKVFNDLGEERSVVTTGNLEGSTT